MSTMTSIIDKYNKQLLWLFYCHTSC